ncbi:chemotaxis protein CheB [Dyadobacter sediminis]|uniref:protein-glutamate methylesterase n=2 Tax=Dyadobacter sediminis TaxID=1493691 RepID=A0A5R9KCB5_9BACT|nr:chemotaxis protein CheB [Dyadobacter sediminis]TLU92424.1 chemotaxis protein CheB [Dyadobacter sediminis]GGB94573.1 chemotaxis protein-glutamate methylesterase [Dyadobacter sediminis]
MQRRDIIVIGASSGGVMALKELVSNLPADFKGSVFIVLHIPAYSESRLPWILEKASKLQAVHPKDGDQIEPGKIYVAVNDHHLIVEEGKVRVKRGPKENRFRPSIDALFRSAAYVYGSRVIGIILSGVLNDGVSGLWTIQQQGGMAIVQDPDDAEQPQLPENTLEYVHADYTISALDMGPIISALVTEPAPERNKFTSQQLKLLELEVIIATKGNAFEMGIMDMGEFTPFTCPQCHGALVRLVENKFIRFRCHTGHAYTASSLLAELSEVVENKLWQTMRGLEEMDMLLSSIADQYKELGNVQASNLFRSKADESGKRAQLIHDLVFEQEQYSEDVRLNKEDV